MNWLQQLFTEPSIAQAVLVYGLVIAFGIWLGRIKLFGVSLGVTWILFLGIALSYMGIHIEDSIEHFLREFGLILFVYAIGLQVGPGFFSSLRKSALTNNILAASVVLLGVATTLVLFRLSGYPLPVMAGVMSGAVTNTPGLAAAQAAASEIAPGNDTSFMALAYAVAYPFGVFGIILSLLLLKRLFGTNITNEQELHRKLHVFRTNKPIAESLVVANRQLFGQPLKRVYGLKKEPVAISRLYQNGKVIVPTPDTIIYEGDVLLLVTSKMEMEQMKLLIGPPSDIDIKTDPESKLISRTIAVTRKEVTHKRLVDIAELHQQDFTMTRLSRAGIEMVPHDDMSLQLGDTIKVVGTEDGVRLATTAVGNSMKRLEVPDLAPIFIGIVLGVVLGSLPFYIPGIPIPVKIGMAGGPLIVALLLSRYGNKLYLNNYTTNSANLMIRELGIGLFLASVGLSSGARLSEAFVDGGGWMWMLMGAIITMLPLLIVGIIARKFFRRTFFETCGLLAGASTDPPALAFALRMAGNDIPSATYATVYPLTMILRILAAQLLILFLL